MRLITKETDYAIRAVASLAARPGVYVSSAEISEKERIPLPFLRRILGRLLAAGLVVSREGAAGGVMLKGSPERIMVLDVMRTFQGPVELSACMFRKRLCANRGTCVLRKRIQEIERSVAAQFGDISIADLLGGAPSSSRESLKGGKCKTNKRGTK
ncbi:MAG: Rrf2 family transcriptional regulator [bacterium]